MPKTFMSSWSNGFFVKWIEPNLLTSLKIIFSSIYVIDKSLMLNKIKEIYIKQKKYINLIIRHKNLILYLRLILPRCQI